MVTRVVIHRAEAFAVTRRIARKLVVKVMREVEAGAKKRALTGEYATGALARSIHRDGPYVTPKLVWGRVGSNKHYAQVAESGARPHPIPPRRPGGMLKFYWRKVGHTVYLPYIRRHPGMKGKHYLEIPLREAAHRHNMRVKEIPR